jgi:hypothetical protein
MIAGANTAVHVVLVQRLDERDEDIVHDILGGRGIAEQPFGQCEQAILVTLVEERTAVRADVRTGGRIHSLSAN